MTPKEALARIKTVIKNFGVYRQYTNSDTPFYEDIENVEQALIELEGYKSAMKEGWKREDYERRSKEALIDLMVIKDDYVCDDLKLELEQLKCDVARYFELQEQAKEKWGNGLDDIETAEYTKLHIKLSKVGKENKESEEK